jgi:hypothetical protein
MNPQDPYVQPQVPPQQPTPGQPLSGQGMPQPTAPPVAPQPAQPPVYPQPLGSIPETPTPTAYPSNYLDTIAAPQTQKTMNKFVLFAMIGGVIIAALVAVLMLSSVGKQPNFSEQAVIVKDRIDTLQLVVDEHQKHLSDNRLRVTNATLSATLTTMNQDLDAITTARKIKVSKKPSTAEAAYRTKLQSTLNDSYQLGSLDRAYPTEMSYQLTLLKTQLRRLKNQAGSKSVTEFYTTSTTSLEQISKDFAAFIGDK